MIEILNCPFCGGEAILRERYINGIANKKHYRRECSHCKASFANWYRSIKKADEAWNRRAQPENNPLTLDELRQMDGEPVYCIDGEGHKAWCIVNANNEDCIDSEAGAWVMAYYGMRSYSDNNLHPMGWIAYRSKPKEEV